MTATMKLHAKLAEVMAEADRIPKNGTYSGQGGFKYVLVGDAADAIRSKLAARKISMLPSAVEVVSEAEHETRSGGTMTTLTIRTTWTLVDGETGETAQIQSIGTGADAGDKASPKAQTNAMKYALLMGFLLSTGDDPEQADTSDRQAVGTGPETLELLGRIQKTGKVEKGGADAYHGEWRETPDGGHAIGFRLKIDGEDKSIPQVLVTGGIGEALYVGSGGGVILGEKITVKGHLYNVKQAGRRAYYRLIVGERNPELEFIETPALRIPAEVPVPAVSPLREDEPEPIPVAEGQEILPLDEEERAAVGGAA